MRKTTRRPGRAGSSPRRSSLTAGAVACAVSIGAGRAPATRPPPPRPPIQIPKTTQRRSQAGSSPIRSFRTAGEAAWAAFPRAAPDRRRPLASRPARPETLQARRHQQSSQLLLLPAAPLPGSRGRSGDSRSSAPYGGCGSADTSDAGHRGPLTARDRDQRGAKPSCTQPCCPLRYAGCPPLLGEQAAAAECQRYT